MKFVLTILLAVAAFAQQPFTAFDVAYNGRVGFRPDRISGLKLWLEPSVLASLNDGDAITTWLDRSGNTNNATQATGANKPIKQTATFGRKTIPVARFDGTNFFMTTTSFLVAGMNTNFTFIVVHAQTNNGAALLATTGHNTLVWFSAQSTAQIFNTSGLSDTQISTPIGDYDYTMNVSSFRYNGATKTARLNGFTINSENATGNLGLNGALTIGRLSSGTNPYKGDIAAIVIYQNWLTDAQIYQVEQYFGAMVGKNFAPQVVFDGNSLTFGQGATAGMDYPTQTIGILGNGYDKRNFGVVGQTTAQMLSDAVNQVDGVYSGFKPRNICVGWEITNSLYNSVATNSIYTDYSTYCTVRRARGFKVVAVTCLPRNNPGTPAGFEAARQGLNASIRANWTSYADALADVGADPTIGDSGDENDTTYYQSDKVHLTDAGYAIVAGIVEDAIATFF
jgi:hypothetical protein